MNPNASPPRPSWLARTGLAVISVLVIIAGFTIATVLFLVLLVAGLIVGGWLWWRLRRLVRQAQQEAPEILDGEFTVEPESVIHLEKLSAPEETAKNPTESRTSSTERDPHSFR